MKVGAPSSNFFVDNDSSIPPFLTLQLLPLFRVLRFIGRAPVSFTKVEVEIFCPAEQVKRKLVYLHYEHKPCQNFMTFISAIVIILVVLFSVTFYGSLRLHVSQAAIDLLPRFMAQCFRSQYEGVFFVAFAGDNNNTATAQQSRGESGTLHNNMITTLATSIELLLTGYFLLGFFIDWLTQRSLIQYWNNWNAIQQEFCTLHNFSSIDIRRFRNVFLLSYLSLFTIPFASFAMASQLPAISSCLSSSMMQFIQNIAFTSFVAIEDTKVILMLRSLQIGFRESWLGLKRFVEENRHDPDGLRMMTYVTQLEKVTRMLRRQAEICGKYFTPSQLGYIALSILINAGMIFVAVILSSSIKERGGVQQYSTIGIFAYFSLLSMSRVAIKVTFANKITQEEKRLADVLEHIEIDFPVISGTTPLWLKLQAFHNRLRFHPTEISLNGYVTLNNRLLIGMFGQVFTFIIVLMQFKLSSE